MNKNLKKGCVLKMTNLKKSYLLAKEISNYFNEINHNIFTASELREGTKQYMYFLNNEKDIVINAMYEEVINTNNDITVVTLYNKVLAF